MIYSVEGGAEVEQHQSTDLSIVYFTNYLIVNSHDRGLCRMVKIKNKKKVTIDDPKYKEILQSILPTTPPVANMIGSGVKRRGTGIKRF